MAGYHDRKGAGLTSPDQDIDADHVATGIEGAVALGARAALTFGAARFEADDGEERRDARLGAAVALREDLALAAEVARTDQDGDRVTFGEGEGARTDLGLRLTRTRGADASEFAFAQGTLSRSGDIAANDRVGLGLTRRLSQALTVAAEVSGGSQGPAAEAEVVHAPSAGSRTSLGYRLDPTRSSDTATMIGTDRGSLVLGAQRAIGESWTGQVENAYSAFGSKPSLASS